MTESSASMQARAASPDALERELDADRNRIAQTLDALGQKMSVGALVDELVRSAGPEGRERAGRIGRRLGQSISENPFPLLLTCIGIAWLIVNAAAIRRTEAYSRDQRDRPVLDEPRPAA